MIDNSDKTVILKKILSSKTFSNVEQYGDLLQFLVNAEIEGSPAKEYTIGVVIFKKGKDFNPANDPSVRTYMHRLRHKIDSYYASEGKNDKIVLTIPKGHYEVRFQHKSLAKRLLWQRLSPLNIIFIGIIAALAVTNLIIFNHYQSASSRQTNEHLIPNDDPIWSDFFSNHLPTTIVIGDHFQFWEFDEELFKSRTIVDYDIHSVNDFELFSKQFSDRKVQKERHGGLPTNCLWNMYDITKVLHSFNQDANIELSSLFMGTKFDLKNIIDRNVIYMGCFRNLRELSTTLSNVPIRYQYTDNFKGIITVKDPETDSSFTFVGKQLDDQHHQDIGLIAKIKGANNEHYMFLVGFAFPAQIETVRLLSRRSLLSNLYSQIHLQDSSFPEQFYLIIEIVCTEFSAIDTKIKYFRRLP